MSNIKFKKLTDWQSVEEDGTYTPPSAYLVEGHDLDFVKLVVHRGKEGQSHYYGWYCSEYTTGLSFPRNYFLDEDNRMGAVDNAIKMINHERVGKDKYLEAVGKHEVINQEVE